MSGNQIKSFIFLTPFLLILILSSLSAQVTLNPIGEERNISINYFADEWIVSLDDESCWEMLTLKKNRKRTWYEWWHNIVPKEWSLDDTYFFQGSKWHKNSPIQVCEVSSLFLGYQHLLINLETQEKAFARYCPLATKQLPKVDHALKIFNKPFGQSHQLSRNLYFINNHLLLDDSSIWHLIPIRKVYRSILEWWNGVTYDQPDPQFVFSLHSWNKTHLIKIYQPGCEFRNDHKMYDPHLSCSKIFLLENLMTGQLAYASKNNISYFIDSCLDYARKQYHDGYSDGYSAGSGSCSCPNELELGNESFCPLSEDDQFE